MLDQRPYNCSLFPSPLGLHKCARILNETPAKPVPANHIPDTCSLNSKQNISKVDHLADHHTARSCCSARLKGSRFFWWNTWGAENDLQIVQETQALCKGLGKLQSPSCQGLFPDPSHIDIHRTGTCAPHAQGPAKVASCVVRFLWKELSCIVGVQSAVATGPFGEDHLSGWISVDGSR